MCSDSDIPSDSLIRMPLRKGLLLAVTAAASLALVAGERSARAQEGAPVEYQVKAAFLLNFAKFVDWPPEAFTAADAPFAIGVFGKDPFHELLDNTVAGKTIGNRKFIVRRGAKLEDLKGCQILFVCRSERDQMARILEKTRHLPILTVGEMDGFAQQCGVINFVIEDNKVHFEINPNAAASANLAIKAQLLRLAHIVNAKCEN